MQKRDERKARAAQGDLVDVPESSIEELGDDADSKAKISVERISVREQSL